MNAVLLDLDIMTNPLLHYFMEDGHDSNGNWPGKRVRSARYRCLWDTAVANLSSGLDVVVVAPFTSELTDEKVWVKLKEEIIGSRPTVLVQLVISDAEARRRCRDRGLPRDVMKPMTDLPNPAITFVSSHADIRLNAADPPQVIANRLMTRLRASVQAIGRSSPDPR